MSDWTTSKLSDVIEIIGGGTPKRSENKYWNGDIPWLSVADFNNDFRYVNDSIEHITELGLQKSSTKLLNKDHLIISARGTVGCLAQLSVPMAFNQSCYGLNGKEGILDNGFLYYFLKNNISELKQKTHGAVFDTITRDTFEHIQISYPDLGTQKEIAKILGSFDDKIELNTQINQTLEQIAQALFKSWFVDFDPVRAKVQALSDGLSLEQAELAAMQAISGKTPEELTALSQTQPDRYAELAETAKAFPCEMVEVDGGEVPKGWEMKALSDLGQIICGKTPSKSNKEFYGDAVPFIKIPDMHNQVFITQTTDNLSVVGANYQSKKYIPAKSICVSCIATVGLVSMTSKPSHTNQQINSIIPDDEQSCEFLYLSLKQPSMTKYLKDLASGGTATFNLNTSTFSKIEIITPSKEIIYIFQKKVVSIFEKTLSNPIENKRLTEIRDLLLPRLLSGEI